MAHKSSVLQIKSQRGLPYGCKSKFDNFLRNLDGRRLRDIEHEKTVEEQRKRKIEREKEVCHQIATIM